MGRPWPRAVGVATSAGLLLVLVGCGHHESPQPTRPAAVDQAFTHVVRDDGCNRRVAPIHLAPLRPFTQRPASGGPTPRRIHPHRGAPPPTRGYPAFPRRLGGLPYRGFSRVVEGPEGVYYSAHPVAGHTFVGVLEHGGLVVSAARFTPNRDRFLSRLPDSLTRVHIGSSPGWINRTTDFSTGTHVLYRDVLWITRDGVYLALSGKRSTARLVALARALVC